MDFRDKSKKQIAIILSFEALGTALLTVIVNILGVGSQNSQPGEETGPYAFNFAMALFAITFICWDIAPSQFNSALAIGQALFNYRDLKETWKSLIMTVLAQLAGTVVGFFLTFLTIYRENFKFVLDNSTSTNTVNYIFMAGGGPMTLCPNYTVRDEAAGNNISRCQLQGQYLKVFLNQFIQSFLFFFAWLLLRNYYINERNHQKFSWDNLLKPVFITIAYTGCQLMGSTFFNGFMNPNLALQADFLAKQFYVYPATFITEDGYQNQYDMMFYYRYAWVYYSAPFAAAILAGYLAQKHVDNLETKIDSAAD